MTTKERDELKEFLDEFVELMNYTLASEHTHWFPPGVLVPLQLAWKEVHPKIAVIKSAIDDQENDSELDEEGFTGEQMKAKMAAWKSAPRRLPWWREVLAWLRPLQGAFKIANAIIESISKVAPPAGGVGEVKKILEGALDIGDGRVAIKKAADGVKKRLRRPPGGSGSR